MSSEQKNEQGAPVPVKGSAAMVAAVSSSPTEGSGATEALGKQPSMGTQLEIVPPPRAPRATGPRTEAGKLRSKYNALKFGVYAKNTVATSECLREDAKKFQELLRQLVEHYQPVDPAHALLVEDFASLTWRIARIVRTETKLVSDHSREKAGEHKQPEMLITIVDYIGAPAKAEEPDKPEESKRKRTAPFLPLPIEGIDALGRQEDRLRRHWLRLYHELERRYSLTQGEPIPPHVVVELE